MTIPDQKTPIQWGWRRKHYSHIFYPEDADTSLANFVNLVNIYGYIEKHTGIDALHHIFMRERGKAATYKDIQQIEDLCQKQLNGLTIDDLSNSKLHVLIQQQGELETTGKIHRLNSISVYRKHFMQKKVVTHFRINNTITNDPVLIEQLTIQKLLPLLTINHKTTFTLNIDAIAPLRLTPDERDA